MGEFTFIIQACRSVSKIVKFKKISEIGNRR